MSEESAIDAAVKRLALALDALDAAVERRKQADRNEEGLAAQVQALGGDRTRLAAALDVEAARSRRLETTNREIAERLDSAITSIQSVVDRHEGDRHEPGERNHRRPTIPPRLRGRAGRTIADACARHRPTHY